jgi:hypothetical protein
MTQQYDQNGHPVPQQPQGNYLQQPQAYPQQGMSPAYNQQGAAPQGQPPMRLDPNAVPDYLRNNAEGPSHNDLDAGAGIGGPRLSIKGKQFRFIEGDTERPYPFGQPLNVVLVTTDPKDGVAKNFYGGAYVEGQDQSPICFSSDGQTPDSGSDQPQSPSCKTCPHNAYGTARNMDGTAGKGKACRDFKRVYVVPYDEPFSEVYELRVPPTSFKNMQAYGQQLVKAGVKMHGVVTQLNFTADTSPVLTFQFMGYLEQNVVAQLDERVNSGELDAIRPSLNKQPAAVDGQSAAPGAVPAQSDAPALGAPQQQPVQPNVPPAGHAPQQPQPGSPVQPGAMAPGAGAAPTPPPAPATPCPLGAPQGFKMTEKGNGVPYQAFVGSGWTDQTLISEGYMVRQ